MGGNIKILIVEDEVISCMFLVEAITRRGYLVTESVGSGEKSIESFLNHKPDLVLMDIQLQGDMDGIEAAAAINAHADVPVIFITGYDEAALKSRALEINPAGYFSKPYNIKNLLKRIDEVAESVKG